MATTERSRSKASSRDGAAAAAVAAVIAAGARAASRGWTPATAGNFSARVDAKRIAITLSGADKGALAADDVAVAAIAAPPAKGMSAEAPLHLALYRDRPEIAEVWHVHSPAAVVLSRLAEADGEVRLEGWELQKVVGVGSHEDAVVIPVLANDQDTERLAVAAAARLAEPAGNTVLAPGYLIAGHGLYAWGRSSAEAWRHVEGLETLLAHELAFRRSRP